MTFAAPNGSFPVDPREAAAWYLAHGMLPIPVGYRAKKPIDPVTGLDMTGWQDLRPTSDDLDHLFPKGSPMNLGLLLGEPSGGLVDADLDTLEAVSAAPLLLPSTGCVSGRSGNPRSHYWYRVGNPPNKASEKYADVDGTVLLELRSTGGQTIAPPGVHESGETIAWNTQGDIAEVDLAELLGAVRTLAACALLARHWPSKGHRQDAYMALVGGLLRAGWRQDRVERFVEALALATHDEELRKRVQVAAQTAAKQETGEKTTGWPRLEEMLGTDRKEVMRRVHEWLGIDSRNCGNSEPQPWPDPIPFDEVPAVPVFPVEVLPCWMRDWSEAQAVALQVPVDLNALLALSYGGAGVARKVRVRVRDDWFEPLQLFTVSALPPGERKSAAFAAAISPVQDYEKTLCEEIAPKIAEAQTAKRQLEARLKHLEGKIAKSEKPGERQALQEQAKDVARDLDTMIIPVEPICYVDDETPESLGQGIAQQGGRMLVSAPEGTVLEIVKGRYSESPVFDVFLKGHAGDPLRTGRIGRGRYVEDRPALSVALSVQPDVIRGLAAEASLKGLGFLARWLYSLPKSLVGRRKIAPSAMPSGIRHRYESLMRKMWEVDYADRDEERPHLLEFDRRSDHAMRSFEAWLEPKLAPDGELASMGGWANKLAGACARIAAILHIARAMENGSDWTGPIPVEVVEAAIHLGRNYLLPHAKAAFSLMGADPRVEGARRVQRWLVANQLKRFQKRDAYQALKGTFKTVDQLEPVLKLLEQHALIRPEPAPDRVGPGRKPSPFFEVHPRLADTCSHNSHNSQNVSLRPNSEDCGNSGNSEGGAGENNAVCQNSGEEPDPDPDVQVSFARSNGALPQPPSFIVVKDSAGLDMVTATLDGTGVVGLDMETTGLDPKTDRVRLLSIATNTVDGGTFTYLVDCFAVDPTPLWAALAEKELVLHNSAFDLAFLARLGFTPVGKVRDTMLLAQLLTAGAMEKVNLANCCQLWLNRAIDKAEQKSDWSGELTESQLAYAARDAAVLAPLLKVLVSKIKEAGLVEAAKIEHRCLPAIVWMAGKGVALDRDGWQSLAHAADEEAGQLRKELDRLAPQKPSDLYNAWNWDSTQQAQQALYLAGCKVDSTADETLAVVDHPLAQLLRRYRLAQKRGSAFGTDWLAHVADDGRVYPSWRQTGAASGRMSCSKPNMQQLPRGDYRKCIVAPPGRVLVKADYSQIELRIAAKVSGDQALLEAYQRGEDLHIITARSVLGIEQVTKQHRQLAKALNFGLLYGMGARGFRQYAKSQYGLDLSEENARRYRDAFFKSYPGLAAWHRRVRLRRAMETRTLSGRRRLLNDKTPDTHRLNTPVQGTGADGLKLAMALLWERRDQVQGAFPVMAVHDEIVVEATADQADAVIAWLKTAMVDAMAPLIAPVPVEAEVRVGITWGGV